MSGDRHFHRQGFFHRMTSAATITHTDSPAPAAGHPRGLYTLFFTEMWERFSYYGMRALLILFMIDSARGGMGLSKPTAAAIYGLYTAVVYLVSLPGGWIADRLMGAQRAVWYGGIIIAAGHFTLAVPSHQAFFMGLLLIVLGTGLLKPNISAIVGGLYPEGDTRRDAGFTIFYMGINLGATIGTLVCSYLAERYNWHYGFAAAGVGMTLGLVQYRLAGHTLGEAGRSPRRPAGVPARGIDPGWWWVAAGMAGVTLVAGLGFAGVLKFNPVKLAGGAKWVIAGMGALYLAGVFAFGGLNAVEKKRLAVLTVLMLAGAMFWSGFEQAGSSLNLFAEEYTQRAITTFHYVIPAGFFQSLNSIFIITLAPLMALVWGALARRKVEPSIPTKFAWGLVLLGVGFLVMVGAAKLVGPGRMVGPGWLVATYFLHTIGELCLSPVGLSAVTKLAPRRFVGQMLGMWFLATALGNLIAGLIAGEVTNVEAAQMPGLYMQIVLITAGTGVVMLALAKPLKKMMGGVQ